MGRDSPYLLPDGNVQIAFSGGRTSAFMLHQILEANGGLPDDGLGRVRVTFQNTGREMPETLDFVQEVGSRWGVAITWLEYRVGGAGFEIVSHNSASRAGEPFEALIRRRGYLPNQQARFCSTELKVRTAKRWLRALGWDYWTNCVGIRADEPHRLAKPPPKDRWTVWLPLAVAGVERHHVSAFWQAQPFDLRLPNVRGNCWLGNCDGCFLKAEANLAALTREFPDRAAWWEKMEALASSLTSGSGGSFSKRYTRAGMREFIERQGDLIDRNPEMFFGEAGMLCQKEDGECTG